MNKLITFEGIDGCGKTTQIKKIAEFLKSNNEKYVVLREPGNTLLSEKIRNILLDPESNINDISETLLFLSARSQLVSEYIEKAINENKFILCDRYIDSTIAYQGYGRGIDLNILYELNKFATKGIFPDLTLIFDLDLDVAVSRISKNKDRIESSGKKFLNRVKNGYLEMSKTESRYQLIHSKTKSIDEIHREVINKFKQLYWSV